MLEMNTAFDFGEFDMLASPNSDSQSRKRLKLWLIEQLDKNTCPGCEWINKETGYFKLIWKHYGRPGFDVHKDAKLFRDWAVHTRRYKPNEPAEVSVWKTRFRNALKKMNKDLEEVTSMHQLEGDSPYRVYRFRGNDEMMQIEMNSNETRDQRYAQHQNISNDEIEINKIKQQLMDNYNLKKIGMSNELKASGSSSDEDFLDILEIIGGKQCTSYDESIPMKLMTFSLYFSENQISTQTCLNDKGVRIAYRPPPVPSNIVEQEGAKEVIKEIFGPLEAHQIYFPYDGEITDRRKILSNMERGLVVKCDDQGDIYVTRLCIARVYYNSDTALQPICLERSKETLVFSFKNSFLPQLENFKQGACKAPSYEICFSFAEKWSSRFPFKGMLTRCVIQHNRSKKLMEEIRGTLSDGECFSQKDDLDKIKDQIERIMISSQRKEVNQQALHNFDDSFRPAISTSISMDQPMNAMPSQTCMVLPPPPYEESNVPTHQPISNQQFSRMNQRYNSSHANIFQHGGQISTCHA